MYTGFPSIQLEGDKERALALIPEGKALLYKAQMVRDNAGVNTFAMTESVGEDGYIYVLCAGATNVIQISVAPIEVDKTRETEEETREWPENPDLLSGLVFKGTLSEWMTDNGNTIFTCDKFAPTPNCVLTHPRLSHGRQSVPRLAVRPWAAYTELQNKGPGPEFSQYTLLRPSMYSGTMKKVVQVVMGLGRISKNKLRDTKQPDAPDTLYMKEVKDNGVQVRFDYKFSRTHGITRAADGRLWLVEISVNRGVLAKPLPIFPQSDTDGFQRRAQKVGDSAMFTAVSELGCLPTGEAFPATAADIERQIEAGNILRLLQPVDLQPFYQCSAYSSAMGWAFSTSGREAHNTGYYFGNDGFQRGVWYQVTINIGASVLHRLPGQPIATGTASLHKQHEGYIYCPPVKKTSPARFVPIKFHEPLLPGLLSHEGVPTADAAGLPVPKVDTVMFVAFNDGDLKTVRYYRNPKQEVYTNTDDETAGEPCLYEGSWTITQTTGLRNFPNMMYSNDIDDRRVLHESITVTKIESKDLGFDPPKFSDFLDAPEACRVWREKVFQRSTHSDSKSGESMVSAVAIPQFSREAYYYAMGSSYAAHNGYDQVSYSNVADPNVGYGWRCFPRVSTPPWPSGIGCSRTNCGGSCSSGGVGTHKERRIVCLNYEAGGCSEYADSGPWLTMCENVNNFNIPPEVRVGSSSSWNKGPDESAKLKLFTPGFGGGIDIPVTYSQVANHWMTPSPDPETSIVQFIYAEHSAIGDDLVVYATNLSTYTGENKHRGYTPENFTSADGFPCPIGVNQP